MDAQTLLDTMDGIAIVLDPKLRISAVGWPNWDAFLRANGGEIRRREEIIGRAIADFITPGPVRDAFRKAFERALEGTRPEIQINYRCDSPDRKRLMRLAVTRTARGSVGTGLLYHSVLLEESQRPTLPLFGAPAMSGAEADILTICSICARVAWPRGAPREVRSWIEAPDYYRRGGEDVSLLSHGFCDDCFRKLMGEAS